ncbi:putative polyketide synthase [Burkholderia pseudomallei]|nr:putative polyketide synthase [Burkholderia pseudomallei]KGX79676.1 putative polyketide synthase [Burkholderia pseudomallei MSHR435]
MKRAALSIRYLFGCRLRLTPPAIATPISPASRSRQARCTATIELEHIVSTARLGPRRSRKNDTRFAMLA